MTREPFAADAVLGRVLALLGDIAGPERTPATAGADTALGADGFRLDSVGLLTAVIKCEEAFGVTLDVTRGFGPSGPGTAGDLARAIRSQL